MALPRYDDDLYKPSIGIEDIERAMGKVRANGRPISLGKKPYIVGEGTNPCSEIIATNNITESQLSPETMRKFLRLPELGKGSSNVASTESNKIYNTSTYADSVDMDFDEAVWRIYVPGVPKENIQLFTVGDIVYVDFAEDKAKRKVFKLADGEAVKSSKLELGVLTVVIDRPVKRLSIEIE